MTNKYILAGIGTLALGGLLAPQLVSAYRGDPNVQGPNYSEERHQTMMDAFEKGDYETWKDEMDGRGISYRINKDNFAQFAKAHQLMLAGDEEGANQIRAELGLGQHDGSGYHNGMGRHMGAR